MPPTNKLTGTMVVGGTTEATGEKEDTWDMEVGVDTIMVGTTGIEGVTVIEVEGMGITGVKAVVRAH